MELHITEAQILSNGRSLSPSPPSSHCIYCICRILTPKLGR